MNFFSSSQAFGKDGEEKAAQFLKKKGFQILESNFRSSLGEIDLIAKDKQEIVFVEVKHRSSTEFGRPEEAVDAKKKRKLIQLAQGYLQGRFQGFSGRFDVVAIVQDREGRSEIRHFPNAFTLDDV
jgi:putative endonuclease